MVEMELLFEINKMCTRFPGAVTQSLYRLGFTNEPR